jgi:hypothetical protein
MAETQPTGHFDYRVVCGVENDTTRAIKPILLNSVTDRILVDIPSLSSTTDSVATIGGLSIPAHDYISLGYDGTNVDEIIYKTGGASGDVVATLALAYTGSDLISITKT